MNKLLPGAPCARRGEVGSSCESSEIHDALDEGKGGGRGGWRRSACEKYVGGVRLFWGDLKAVLGKFEGDVRLFWGEFEGDALLLGKF